MAVFRVHLVDNDKHLKLDLNAADEQLARSAIWRWLDDADWQIVKVRRLYG